MQYTVFLIVIADFYIASGYGFSLIYRHHAVDHFQKSGFTGAVLAYNSHFFPSFYFKVHMRKKVLFAETFGKISDR